MGHFSVAEKHSWFTRHLSDGLLIELIVLMNCITSVPNTFLKHQKLSSLARKHEFVD